MAIYNLYEKNTDYYIWSELQINVEYEEETIENCWLIAENISSTPEAPTEFSMPILSGIITSLISALSLKK